tara:strand:- start:22219 stop:24144 length:1926 start_codon:yes stop_codon:yes gene_type:complete
METSANYLNGMNARLGWNTPHVENEHPPQQPGAAAAAADGGLAANRVFVSNEFSDFRDATYKGRDDNVDMRDENKRISVLLNYINMILTDTAFNYIRESPQTSRMTINQFVAAIVSCVFGDTATSNATLERIPRPVSNVTGEHEMLPALTCEQIRERLSMGTKQIDFLNAAIAKMFNIDELEKTYDEKTYEGELRAQVTHAKHDIEERNKGLRKRKRVEAADVVAEKLDKAYKELLEKIDKFKRVYNLYKDNKSEPIDNQLMIELYGYISIILAVLSGPDTSSPLLSNLTGAAPNFWKNAALIMLLLNKINNVLTTYPPQYTANRPSLRDLLREFNELEIIEKTKEYLILKVESLTMDVEDMGTEAIRTIGSQPVVQLIGDILYRPLENVINIGYYFSTFVKDSPKKYTSGSPNQIIQPKDIETLLGILSSTGLKTDLQIRNLPYVFRPLESNSLPRPKERLKSWDTAWAAKHNMMITMMELKNFQGADQKFIPLLRHYIKFTNAKKQFNIFLESESEPPIRTRMLLHALQDKMKKSGAHVLYVDAEEDDDEFGMGGGRGMRRRRKSKKKKKQKNTKKTKKPKGKKTRSSQVRNSMGRFTRKRKKNKVRKSMGRFLKTSSPKKSKKKHNIDMILSSRYRNK